MDGAGGHDHTQDMRYILLALAVSGCLASRPIEGQTTWTVALGAWDSPQCRGQMTATVEHGKLFGAWACGHFGRRVEGEIRQDGRVFLDLETSPGFLNRVRGAMVTEDAIAGDILLDGVLTPFAAYRQ